MFSFANNKPQEPLAVKQQQQARIDVEPVDVQYDKIKDWLLSRRFIQSDYATRLKTVQSYAQEAFKQLATSMRSSNENQNVDNQLKSLVDQVECVEGDYLIDYEWCHLVWQLLEQLDKNTTTFGYGGSQRLKNFRRKAISMGIKNAPELAPELNTKNRYDRNIISHVKLGRGQMYTQFREQLQDKQRKQDVVQDMKEAELALQGQNALESFIRQKSAIQRLKEQKEKEAFVYHMRLMADPKHYSSRKATTHLSLPMRMSTHFTREQKQQL